jgi:hypothetical protein
MEESNKSLYVLRTPRDISHARFVMPAPQANAFHQQPKLSSQELVVFGDL